MLRALLIDLGDTILRETGSTRTCTRNPELVPGAKEAIIELARRYTLAIVRNADTGVERVWSALRQVGIADCFSLVVVSGDVGVRKPDPRIFLIALERLGLKPEDVIVIGDQVEADIVGANRVGCKSILLRWNDYYPADCSDAERRPTFVARSWPDVIGIIERLEEEN